MNIYARVWCKILSHARFINYIGDDIEYDIYFDLGVLWCIDAIDQDEE